MDLQTQSLLAERRKDPRLLAWVRLVRLVKRVRARVEGPMEGHDLTGAQLHVLVIVGTREGSNQQECAARLDVTKGNIAQHVARLEARGLITREVEGRNKTLSLTPAGHAVLQAVVPAHDEGVDAALAVLSGDELRQLSGLLRKVERSLE